MTLALYFQPHVRNIDGPQTYEDFSERAKTYVANNYLITRQGNVFESSGLLDRCRPSVQLTRLIETCSTHTVSEPLPCYIYAL